MARARENTRAYTRVDAEHPEHPEQTCSHAGLRCSGYPEHGEFHPEQGSLWTLRCAHGEAESVGHVGDPTRIAGIRRLQGASGLQGGCRG